MSRLLVLILGVLSFAPQATSEIVMLCAASNGYSFFLPGGLVSPDKSGWASDSISDGNIQLLRDNNQYDIVYTDTIGTRSMRAEGFEVYPIPQSVAGLIVILAVHHQTGVVEHYMFRNLGDGGGHLIWGTIRGNGLIDKSSLYHSLCQSG